jgi:hypothetical protein
MYAQIAQFQHQLRQLDKCLEKAAANAEARKFDVNVLATSRLAPDMYHLCRQIGAACDAAKFAAGRLSGRTDIPKHPDTETTIGECRTRIASVLEYMASFNASNFEKAESLEVKNPVAKEATMKGVDYLNKFVMPNFYFHVVTAYAIMRHNGVDIGKMDYLGRGN